MSEGSGKQRDWILRGRILRDWIRILRTGFSAQSALQRRGSGDHTRPAPARRPPPAPRSGSTARTTSPGAEHKVQEFGVRAGLWTTAFFGERNYQSYFEQIRILSKFIRILRECRSAIARAIHNYIISYSYSPPDVEVQKHILQRPYFAA